MPIEIKWTDADPLTGDRRFVRAERFARTWCFTYRTERRSVWAPGPPPTRVMWEHVLEMLQRRYRRRAGVTETDLVEVRRILAKLPMSDAEEGE